MGANFGYILLDREVDADAIHVIVLDACVDTEAQIVDVSVATADLAPLFENAPPLVVTAITVRTDDANTHPGVDEIAERLVRELGCGAIAGSLSDFYQSAAYQHYRMVPVDPEMFENVEPGEMMLAASGLLVDTEALIGGRRYSYLDVAWLAVEALFRTQLVLRDEHRTHAAERFVCHPGEDHRILEDGEVLDPARVVDEDEALEVRWSSMRMTHPLSLRHVRKRMDEHDVEAEQQGGDEDDTNN